MSLAVNLVRAITKSAGSKRKRIIPTTRCHSTKAKPYHYAQTAVFLGAAVSSDSIPHFRGLPEVIVTGRANVGKSTLLKEVLGRKDLVFTSKKAGHTRALNFFRLGPEPGKLVLVDAPGYGGRGRPEWGDLFCKYVETRSELHRIYILFNGKHGLNDADIAMLTYLNDQCLTSHGTRFTLQSIITKADTIPRDNSPSSSTRVAELREQIFKAAPTCLPPIVTSAAMHPMFGVEEVRKSVFQACGLPLSKS